MSNKSLDLSRVRHHFHKRLNRQTGRQTKIQKDLLISQLVLIDTLKAFKMSLKSLKRLFNNFVTDRRADGPKSPAACLKTAIDAWNEICL